MVGLTQMEGAIYLPHWQDGLVFKIYILNSRLQVGGLFLTAFLGGGISGALSQLLYLLFGLLSWNGMQVFGEGGGIGYWREPTFGYLIGFLPGAYLGGIMAFSRPRCLVNFTWSGILALVVIHLSGMGYLLFHYSGKWQLLWESWYKYSIVLIPAHLAIVCSCSLIAYVVRLILLY